MHKHLDTRSALVGLLLGIGAMLALGAANRSTVPAVGRYQIGATSNHGLVLDTATGQVWAHFFSSSGGNTSGDFFLPKPQLDR